MKEVLQLIEEAKMIDPSNFLKNLSNKKELSGNSEWYDFEHRAWKIGENIRQEFVKNPKLKKDRDILSEILGIVKTVNLRRGRQSFVLLLGFVGAKSFAPALALFLEDKDIDGHILDTLLKMRASGYTEKIRPLLNSDKTWIKKLAKKYCERYSD